MQPVTDGERWTYSGDKSAAEEQPISSDEGARRTITSA